MTPWTIGRLASLSSTISWSLLKLMSIYLTECLIEKKEKKERNIDLSQCWRKISCVILAERKHVRFQQNTILLGRDFRGNKYNFYLTIAPNPLLRYNPTVVVYTFLLQTCIITFVILKKGNGQYFNISVSLIYI